MKISTKLSQPAINTFNSEEAEAIYYELKSDGYPLFISKKQYSEIIGCSLSTVDNYLKQGYGICNYKKLGNAKNARVLFNLIDVSNYLSNTIKTA